MESGDTQGRMKPTPASWNYTLLYHVDAP
jgi:hypothetical protein